MRRLRGLWVALAAAVLGLPGAGLAAGLRVAVDASAARGVLDAVGKPRLTIDEALAIARLPGNQGLIRKAKSYGRPASDDLFARALVAAAHRDAGFVDVAKFRFDAVRDHAVGIERTLAGLADPHLHLLDTVKTRIAAFTPAGVDDTVTGYLVVGGTSGGFAFGEPKFYLDLDRFPSPILAATIMEHELYHAAQAIARAARRATPAESRCLARIAHAEDIETLFGPLSAEGTASYVGDALALPETGTDTFTEQERARAVRNVGMVDRSIVQLELSVHGLTTGAAVSADEVYALGFYGDEVLYALGYVMARAIAREQGDGAIADLIGLPGAAFVSRYVHLKDYGRTDTVPALKRDTIKWAEMVSACFDPQS